MKSKIVFTITAKGEKIRGDLLHLLNDLRNLDLPVFVLTDLSIDLDYLRYDNVQLVECKKKWSDFDKLTISKHAFNNTDAEYVYSLDADSRFVNYRPEKFNKQSFLTLLDSISFDVLCSWDLGEKTNAEWHLRPVNPNEHRETGMRYYNYGFDSVIKFLRNDLPNYNKSIKESNPHLPLENAMIFKRSLKIFKYIDNLLKLNEIIVKEHNLCGRDTGPVAGFALSLYKDKYNMNIHISPIACQFFSPNFVNEMPLWNSYPKNFNIFL
tara:strand:- start:1604 stop:2404 length:801 start_codon:yes stop_codon:yes gene_type:complete